MSWRIARHDSSGAVYYLYDDANGSLRTATNASGTQLCWADYYPFGEPVAGTGCWVDNYQFAGLYADATGEDGNYSAAHRRYNYSYYRWLSPDPGGAAASDLSDSQSWDMYSYVGDNPITGTDPGGEDQRICQTGNSGTKTNCVTLTDRQYDIFVEKNKDTLSFAGSKIFVNGTQIGTTEYIPTIDPSTAFALHAVGQFADAEVKSAAVSMAINGALAGAGALVGAYIDWAAASEETGTPVEINWGQQEKHFEGHNSYIPGRSTLTANPEELAQEAGNGTPANSVPRGAPGFKERVDFGRVIGTYRDPVTGFSAPTTKGMIVYSKEGVHIYPIRP